MIKVENLSKKYGNHYAIKDLSFEIEKGNVYGFLGPNGAGKSTTMNIMTGYIAASEGKVTIDGHDILREAEKAKALIGYLPEIPPLYQDMTIEEYLMFVAELKKVPKKERKNQVADVMEKTFITDMSKRLIKNLSKGYKQRVGLAQAMLGNPDIIILDEPTVGLDPKQIIEIRELIRELKKEHTVILSSHILSEIEEVCDRIMIIAKGRLVASGTSEELLEQLGGNNTIEFTVKGSADKLDKVIDSFECVKSKELEESDGFVACKIVIENDLEIRDELFDKLATAKLPIYKMAANQKSLEDIFLEVTSDEHVALLEARLEKEAEELKAKKLAESQNDDDEDEEDETTSDESCKSDEADADDVEAKDTEADADVVETKDTETNQNNDNITDDKEEE